MDYLNQPWHGYKQHALLQHNWCAPDTEENFKQLMQSPAHKDYFRAQGWLEPHSITYRFNKQGFRGDDFDSTQPTLLTLGCSFTMGIGLAEHQTWPWLVGNELGLRVANVAHGGWSADTCFRMAEYWIPTLMPRLVIMLAPPVYRMEIHTGNHDVPVDNIMHGQPQWENDRYIKCWFSEDENSRINSLKNRLAVERICNKLGIECLTYDATQWFARGREEVGYARDYMHAGPIGHQKFKEQILNDQTRFRYSTS